MANRTFNQFGGTLERKVIKLFAKIIFGGGGSATLVTSQIINASTSPVTINPSQGIESLTDNGGGNFKLTLGSINGGTLVPISGSTTQFTTTGAGVPTFDPYVRLLNVSASSVIAAGGPPSTALINAVTVVDNVNGNAGSPSLTLQTVIGDLGTGAVSAAAPASGTTVLVEVTLSNTTAY
jgi:hypothetical protein